MPHSFQEAYDRFNDTSSSVISNFLANPSPRKSVRMAIQEEHKRFVIETYNIMTSKLLSTTIKPSQEDKIDGEIWEQVDRKHDKGLAERDSALRGLARRSARSLSYRTVRRTKRYRNAIAEQQTFAMETIPEDDVEDAESTQQIRRPTGEDMKRSQSIATKISRYTQLMASNDTPADLQKPIEFVLGQFRLYQFASGQRDRPRFEDLLNYDREFMNKESDLQMQLQFQVLQLRDFLGSLLFGEYVSMKPDCSDRNKCWKLSGRYLLWQDETGPPKEEAMEQLAADNACAVNRLDEIVGGRFNRMIRASGLDESYVKDRLRQFVTAPEHGMGEWQRYVREYRWSDLATKLLEDRRRADNIIGGQGEVSLTDLSLPRSGTISKCRVLLQIQLVEKTYFKTLFRPDRFELSSKAFRMEETREGREPIMQQLDCSFGSSWTSDSTLRTQASTAPSSFSEASSSPEMLFERYPPPDWIFEPRH